MVNEVNRGGLILWISSSLSLVFMLSITCAELEISRLGMFVSLLIMSLVALANLPQLSVFYLLQNQVRASWSISCSFFCSSIESYSPPSVGDLSYCFLRYWRLKSVLYSSLVIILSQILFWVSTALRGVPQLLKSLLTSSKSSSKLCFSKPSYSWWPQFQPY